MLPERVSKVVQEEPSLQTATETSILEPYERSGDDARFGIQTDADFNCHSIQLESTPEVYYNKYVHEFLSRMTYLNNRRGNTLSYLTNEQLLRRSKPYEGPKGANVFIFHLPSNVDNLTLYVLFRKFGDLISARVMVNFQTGQSRGFGFVSFTDELSAKYAVQYMNGFPIGRKRLKVAIKKHKHNKSCDGLEHVQQQQSVIASRISKKASNADST